MPTQKKKTPTAYSKQELLLQRIREMLESDFTKIILIPLFTKMGYEVDYYGGPAEGGKDLIMWRAGDFDTRDLIVVQVKKTKFSAAAASGSSLSGIVNQLQQASEKEVPYKSGEKTLPHGVYFITPYQIDTRALESRFEKVRELASRRVRVLDGVDIFNQLQKLLPDLVDEICGSDFSIKNNLLTNLSNADLLSALNYRKEKRIDEFYSDLDFGVGRVTSKLFFSLTFRPTLYQCFLTEGKWEAFDNCTRRILDQFGHDMIVGGRANVMEDYFRVKKLWNSEQNQKTIADIEKHGSEVKSILRFILDECKDIIADALILSSDGHAFAGGNVKLLTKIQSRRLDEIKQSRDEVEAEANRFFSDNEVESWEVSSLRIILSSVEEQVNNLRTEKAILNAAVAKRLTGLLRNIQSLNKIYELLRLAYEKRLHKPTYEVRLDGPGLVNQLSIHKKFIANGISKLSRKNLTKNEIKEFFQSCQKILGLVEEILSHKILVDAIGLDDSQRFSLQNAHERIHLPVREVFFTGINCAVFGEAGAGKSTTLYRYASEASAADSDDEITLFLPLTRLLSNRLHDVDDDQIKPLKKLEHEIWKFLNVKGKSTESEIVSFLKGKRRAVFIFDGIDEVIKSFPWIIEAIRGVVVEYTNSQIITSARASGTYVDSLEFLSLTLLPFTRSQVDSFVLGWFKLETTMARKVIAHLEKTPTLAEIVTNPLLATVLCVLAENEVPLPEGELEMYSERMKLLLGHYDIHKKSRRLVTHHSILEITARKLAYHLQQNGIRALPPADLEEVAVTALKRLYVGADPESFRVAVRELHEPCNILQPMTDDGAFGFGHLRFQEYLCATELCQNRGIDILPHLASPWWRSVLVLFARLTNDIHPVFEDVISRAHNVTKYRDTLLALIETRPKNLQPELKNLIKQHARMDSMERDLKEFYDYDGNNENDGDDFRYLL
jgi:hypothetical protein